MIFPQFTDFLTVFFVGFGPTKFHRKCNLKEQWCINEDPYLIIIPKVKLTT